MWLVEASCAHVTTMSSNSRNLMHANLLPSNHPLLDFSRGQGCSGLPWIEPSAAPSGLISYHKVVKNRNLTYYYIARMSGDHILEDLG